MTARPNLSPAQRRNFRALAKSHKRLAATGREFEAAFERRHAAVLKILDELERHPEGYCHLIRRGKRKQERPLTPATVRSIRKKYERQVLKQEVPNPRGGPGCRECEDLDGCWCMFKLGPLCCYLCASPAVIQCYF